MSMAMPRSDDVPAESQPMMFVLASDMEPLGRSDKAVDKGDFLNAHVFMYVTSMNVIGGWKRKSGNIPYEQCNSHCREERRKTEGTMNHRIRNKNVQ